MCSFNVVAFVVLNSNFSCKHRRPIEKCLWQYCQFVRVNKRLSPWALFFVFPLCRLVSQIIQKLLICAIVYFVLTYSAWAPFAYLRPVKTLFSFFKNRVASLPKSCLTSASNLISGVTAFCSFAAWFTRSCFVRIHSLNDHLIEFLLHLWIRLIATV